jgi:hypothetical protein
MTRTCLSTPYIKTSISTRWANKVKLLHNADDDRQLNNQNPLLIQRPWQKVALTKKHLPNVVVDWPLSKARRHHNRRQMSSANAPNQDTQADSTGFEGETAAERKRRLGALGVGGDDSPESDSDGEEGGDPMETGRGTHTRAGEPKNTVAPPRTPGIRFAEQPRIPTKDERMADDAQDKEVRDHEKKKTGLGKLFRK